VVSLLLEEGVVRLDRAEEILETLRGQQANSG
jgi:hypothetical protein